MGNPPFEDVSPIKHGGFPASYVSLPEGTSLVGKPRHVERRILLACWKQSSCLMRRTANGQCFGCKCQGPRSNKEQQRFLCFDPSLKYDPILNPCSLVVDFYDTWLGTYTIVPWIIWV